MAGDKFFGAVQVDQIFEFVELIRAMVRSFSHPASQAKVAGVDPMQ
jgi:hypothetical protein